MKKEMNKKNKKQVEGRFSVANNRKGISPIISTVMLVLIVIVIAVMVLLWSSGFIKEKVLKFDKSVDTVCLEVSLETYVNSDNTIGLRNKGIVPIQEVKLIVNEGGNEMVYPIGIEEGKVGAGLSNTITTHTYSSGKEMKVIPVLIGRTKSGAIRKVTCPESTGVRV